MPKSEDDIVRDGQVIRVPLILMDDVQRAVMTPLVVDTQGRPAGNRPGLCLMDVQGDQRPAAYGDYVQRTGDAWRGASPPVGDSKNAHADYVANLTSAWKGGAA